MARSSWKASVVLATSVALLAYVGCGRQTEEPTADTPSATSGTTATAPKRPPAKASGSETFPPWSDAKGVLVVTGEIDGYMEPCGCTDGQMGGLIRRYEFVRRLGDEKKLPHALIDLGGLIKDPAGARGGFEQAKIKFGIALKALGAFDYSALALSPADLKVGVGEAFAQFLNGLHGSMKLVAANVVPGPGFEEIIQRSVLAEAGPIKLGITAVVDPEAMEKLVDPDKDDLLPTVLTPDEVLADVLKELESSSDYQVLMVQAPLAEARRLAAAFPGFDIIVATSEVPDPEEDAHLLNDGKTMLVNVGRRGKYLGTVGFFEGEAPKYHRVGLTPALDPKEKSEVKKIIEDEYRSLLKAIGTVENFPRHDYVGGAPGAKFVGAESCKDCHPATFQKWSLTKHAYAFDSLLHDPKPDVIYDAECITCHTTGFEYNSGWISTEATLALKGNQCENCHGPASRHIAAPEDETFRNALKLTADQADKNRLCTRCHDEDNSPRFTFETYWPKVEHKGLDTYTDPKVWQGITPKND